MEARYGRALTDEQAQELIEGIDTTGDGKVCYGASLCERAPREDGNAGPERNPVRKQVSEDEFQIWWITTLDPTLLSLKERHGRCCHSRSPQ